jgi:hypothetical protein
MEYPRRKQYLLALADQAARRATAMKDPRVRQTMHELAQLYRHLAQQAGELAGIRASLREGTVRRREARK